MKAPTSPHGERKFTYGSLFAGVGGFDLGFDQAGWEGRWQVEWDTRCRSVLAHHWPHVARYGDVRDVRGGPVDVPLARRTHHAPLFSRPVSDPDGRGSSSNLLEPVDIISYGFPCQDLSVAGKRTGLDGDRSNLFFEAIRIFREMRDATDGRYPRVVVAENVRGLLSADGGAAMGRCLDALADIGAVDIEWAMLDAQHFGVPQRRQRVFIVARFDSGANGVGPLLPVRESCPGRSTPVGATRTEVAALTGRGVGTCGADDNQAQAGHLIPAVKARRAQSVDDYETWVTDAPAPTLNAFHNGTESRATVLSATATGVRRLSPRECERLMGWPDDHTQWAADGKQIADTVRYRMCGNGVVAPVARWIAERINDAYQAGG